MVDRLKIPLWLLTGLLYGLSWPLFEGVNLSFLTWFAFVPLFVFLDKNQNSFCKSILGSYASMVVFGTISAAWLFNFPQSSFKVAVIFFSEEIWFFVPFLILFFIQKKIGFDKSLWLLPFIWTLWEWMYLGFEFAMGTHLSAYSQSSNLWLIQYIDITGMWGVSFWIMLFNVLLFKIFKAFNYDFKNPVLYKKIILVSALMLTVPLLYGGYAFIKYKQTSPENITVSLIPTQFSASYLSNPENGVETIEKTLHTTDSLAFWLKENNKHSDLFVWPETGISYKMGFSNLNDLLKEAVTDWESALVTGCKGVPQNQSKTDQRTHVSAALIAPENTKTFYHHKTFLTPGQEAIPYHSFLASLPSFPIKVTDANYYKKGTKSEPLDLITKKKEKFRLGVSLCFEQWHPIHWVKTTQNGADFFVHLAGEGWYGTIGFRTFMTNVTRMRCIETRRQTARCANVGMSLFIDQLGRYTNISQQNSLETQTAQLYQCKAISWYVKHPNWFPMFCLLFLISFSIYTIIQKLLISKTIYHEK